MSSGEKPILGFGDVQRSRALFVIVPHMIDATAHGVAPHLPAVIGLQQFRHRRYVLHSRIEPQIVAVGMENHKHPVVDR